MKKAALILLFTIVSSLCAKTTYSNLQINSVIISKNTQNGYYYLIVTITPSLSSGHSCFWYQLSQNANGESFTDLSKSIIASLMSAQSSDKKISLQGDPTSDGSLINISPAYPNAATTFGMPFDWIMVTN